MTGSPPAASGAATEQKSPAVPENSAQPDGQPGKWSDSLEYVEGNSSKFWEIMVSGNEQTVRFGLIGSRGQSLTKSFPNHDAALTDSKRQAEAKRKKGYRPKA